MFYSSSQALKKSSERTIIVGPVWQWAGSAYCREGVRDVSDDTDAGSPLLPPGLVATLDPELLVVPSYFLDSPLRS